MHISIIMSVWPTTLRTIMTRSWSTVNEKLGDVKGELGSSCWVASFIISSSRHFKILMFSLASVPLKDSFDPVWYSHDILRALALCSVYSPSSREGKRSREFRWNKASQARVKAYGERKLIVKRPNNRQLKPDGYMADLTLNILKYNKLTYSWFLAR